MLIDENSYKLTSNNYVEKETIKKIIVIGHTNNRDMRHMKGWLHRYNGMFKRTAAFTIDINGCVYKHFDPKYHSRFFNNPELDSKSIVILLENEGWLLEDNEKKIITYTGDIYNKEVINKKWRGQVLWAPYSEKQLEVTSNLVKSLCDEFNISVNPIEHNTKIDGLFDETIIYKSNLSKNYTDLNPTWDFKYFKNKLETNKNENER